MSKKGLTYLRSSQRAGELTPYTAQQQQQDLQRAEEFKKQQEAAAAAKKKQENEERLRRRQAEGIGIPTSRDKKAAPPRKRTNPLQAFQGAADAAERGVQKVRRGVAGAFGIDQQELERRDAQGKQQQQQTQRRVRGQEKDAQGRSTNMGGRVTSEAVKAVVGVPARLVEGAVDTGALGIDVARTVGNAVQGREDNTRNPFHPEYIAPRLQTGIAEPETGAGKLAQGLLTFGAGITIAHRQVTNRLLGPGATKMGKFTRGEISSGIADILLTRAGDTNLSGLVQSLVPEEHRDNFLFLLAANEKDGELSARGKSILESMVLGMAGMGLVAGAGVVKGILRGRKAVQAAVDAGKQGDDALKAGLDAAADTINKESGNLTQAAVQEGRRFEETRIRELDDANKTIGEVQQSVLDPQGRSLDTDLRDMESFAAEAKAMGIPDDDPTLMSALEKIRELEARKQDLQSKLDNGYTPADMELLPQERSAQFVEGDINTASVNAAVRDAQVPSPGDIDAAPVSILTDAQVKLMQWEDKVITNVEAISRNADLQAMARDARMSDAELVRRAKPVIADVLEQYDLPGFDFVRTIDEKGLIERVQKGDTTDLRLDRVGIVVTRAVVQDLADRAFRNADSILSVDELARGPWGNLGDKLLDTIAAQLTLLKKTSQAAGGGVRAYGVNPNAPESALSMVTKGQSSVEAALDQVQKIRDSIAQGSPEAKQQLRTLALMMREAGPSPIKQASFISLVGQVGIKQATQQYTMSIFSGLRTHAMNLTGNIYSVLERPTSMMLHSLTGNQAEFRAAMAGYKALATGLSDAIGATFSVIKNGSESAKLAGGEKWVEGKARQVEQLEQMRVMAQGNPGKELAVKLLELNQRVLDSPLFDWPGRFLTGVDEGFQTLTLNQWAHMTSTHRALLNPDLNVSRGDQIASYLTEFNKKIDGKSGRIKDADLREWINQATFQGKPAEITEKFADLVNHWPVLRFVVPVVNTPAELLRYVGKHTPLLNKWVTGEYAQVLQAAKAKDPEALAKLAVIEGRTALGTLLAASGIFTIYNLNHKEELDSEGRSIPALTGAGPAPGTTLYRAWQSMGIKPYTITVNGKQYSYEAIEPIKSILGLMADASMLLSLGSQERGQIMSGQIAFSLAANLTDKSMLQGIQDIAQLVSPDTWGTSRERVLMGILNNNVPYAGARRMAFNVMSPYLMEVRSQMDRELNAASAGLAIRGEFVIDPLTGRRHPSWVGGFYNATSPVRIADVNQDSLKEDLFRARFSFPESRTGVLAMKLTPEEKAEMHTRMFENGLRDQLQEVMDRPGFWDAVEEYKHMPWNSDEPSTQPPHIRALTSVWSKAKKQALAEMREAYADFDAKVSGEEDRRDRLNNLGLNAPNDDDSLNKLMQAPR
jgi:hypothetical protein